jgi:hypothetical protein
VVIAANALPGTVAKNTARRALSLRIVFGRLCADDQAA